MQPAPQAAGERRFTRSPLAHESQRNQRSAVTPIARWKRRWKCKEKLRQLLVRGKLAPAKGLCLGNHSIVRRLLPAKYAPGHLRISEGISSLAEEKGKHGSQIAALIVNRRRRKEQHGTVRGDTGQKSESLCRRIARMVCFIDDQKIMIVAAVSTAAQRFEGIEPNPHTR